MTRTVVLMVVAIVVGTSCARSVASEISGHHHRGDRMGSHGMVLFGKRHHFVEHIPMFRAPHDEQLILRVTVRKPDGTPVERDFSDTGYSIEPTSELSLDDLVVMPHEQFAANIHKGNFEQHGPVVMTDARFTVDAVLVARNLPSTEAARDGDQEYFLVGEPGDAYLTNVIRANRGFQQILRVDAVEGVTPAGVIRIVAAAPGRLPVARTSANAGGKPVQLTIGAELWCLTAPEFVENCQ